jgi:hypothetical protein
MALLMVLKWDIERPLRRLKGIQLKGNKEARRPECGASAPALACRILPQPSRKLRFGLLTNDPESPFLRYLTDDRSGFRQGGRGSLPPTPKPAGV